MSISPPCQFYNLLMYGSVQITDPAQNSELIPHSLFFCTVDPFQPNIIKFSTVCPNLLGQLSHFLNSPYSQLDWLICSLGSALCFCMSVVWVYNFLQLEYSLVFLNTCCIYCTSLTKVQPMPLPGSFPCLLLCQRGDLSFL